MENAVSTPSTKRGLRLGTGKYLRGIGVVLFRELGATFDSSIAYIYFIAFTVLSVGIFMNDFFIRAVVDMTPYFEILPMLLIIFIPALTMRTWSEEKRVLTFELLITLPLKTSQLVIGKYFAVYLFYLLTLLGSLPIVVMLMSLGNPDPGLIFSGYLGAAFLGAVFVSIGCLTSGLTGNQIVAFVLAALLGFVFVFSGNEAAVAILDGLTPRLQIGSFIYESISIMPHYESLTRGVLSAANLFYFAAMTILFLWINGISVNRSRP